VVAPTQLWRYELGGNAEATQLLAAMMGNNKRPMWWQGRLYFISDRGGSDNLWSWPPTAASRAS
jgi:tricorn protease